MNPEAETLHSCWHHSDTLSSGASYWPEWQRQFVPSMAVQVFDFCSLQSSQTSAPLWHWYCGQQTVPIWAPKSARGPAPWTSWASRSGWESDRCFPLRPGRQMSQWWSLSPHAPVQRLCNCFPHISAQAVFAVPPQNRWLRLHTHIQTSHAGSAEAPAFPNPCRSLRTPANVVSVLFAPLGLSNCHCRRKGHYTQTPGWRDRHPIRSCSATSRRWCRLVRGSAGRNSSHWCMSGKGRSSQEV